MNILLFAPDYPPQQGGVAEYSAQLADELCKLKQNTCVVTGPRVGGSRVSQNDLFTIRHNALHLWWRRPHTLNSPVDVLRFISWLKYQISYVYSAFSLYKNIDSWQRKMDGIDIVLLTWLSPAAADYVLHYYRKRSLPYCVLAHGKEITTLVDRKERYLLDARDMMLLETLSFAERTFCASAFTRDEVLKLGVGCERVSILHPGVSAELIRIGRQAPTLHPREQDGFKPLLVSLGRLVERKGYDYVIYAVEALLARGIEVDYMILGDGPERLRLQQLINERGLNGVISMSGPITECEKHEWLSKASLFVLPVRELADRDVEGYGIVFLEAAAFGVPAVAGRSGGAPEAVLDGETGLIVDPEDVDQIADAIECVLTDRALHERLSVKARAHAAQQTWGRVAERFLSEIRPLFEVEHAGCR